MARGDSWNVLWRFRTLGKNVLAIAKKSGNKSRKKFTALLHWQHEARTEKTANAIAMKLQLTKKDLINISYLYQQYFSPHCWKTVCQALDKFEKLTLKKDKLECVKEQILIRYLGLGWEEAHRSWSKTNTNALLLSCWIICFKLSYLFKI